MAKNPNGKSKQVKNDAPMNGAMKFFLTCCVAELYLLVVRRFYINGTAMQQIAWYDTYLKVFMGLGELRGLFPMAGAFAQADNDIDAALCQVFGMGVALGAEADNGNSLAVQHAEVAIGIIILVDSHDDFSFLSFV